MKKRIYSLFLFALLLTPPGVVLGEEKVQIVPADDFLGASSAEERDLLVKTVVTHMVQPKPFERTRSHFLNRIHRTVFLSLGAKFDPTPELLTKLNDLPLPVDPASQANRKGSYIFNDEGERAAMITIRNIGRGLDGRIYVEGALATGGGHGGFVKLYEADQIDGQWKVVDERVLVVY